MLVSISSHTYLTSQVSSKVALSPSHTYFDILGYVIMLISLSSHTYLKHIGPNQDSCPTCIGCNEMETYGNVERQKTYPYLH